LPLDGRPAFLDGFPFDDFGLTLTAKTHSKFTEAYGKTAPGHTEIVRKSLERLTGLVSRSDLFKIRDLHASLFSADGVSFASGPKDTVFEEAMTDSGVAASEFFGDLNARKTGLVKFDQIRDIKRFSYVGHVYCLRSIDGTMITENVIAKQCRCTMVDIFNEEDGPVSAPVVIDELFAPPPEINLPEIEI